jgi:hypothetical protein
MGPQRAAKLQAKGIKNFKELMAQATRMDEAAFKQEFGGRDGALDTAAAAYWEVLNTWYQAQQEKQGHKVSQTDAWLAWADSHKLPEDSLELRQGWPPGMLGSIRVEKLAAQGVTSTKQLMAVALTTTHDQFVGQFGGAGGALDNRASAFWSFLTRSAAYNRVSPGRVSKDDGGGSKTQSPNFMLIAVVLLVIAMAYKFMA